MFTFLIICVSSLLNHSHAQHQHEYDVIIMGAGASGIAAAKTLYEANITNILMIEAQWYVGGRVVTHHFSDYMLNIGASWISGACLYNCSDYNETNPMLDAAYKYNLSFVISDFEGGVILDFGGKQHNVTNSNNRYEKLYEAQDCAWDIMQNVSRHDYMSYFAALHLCGWSTDHAIDKTMEWLNFAFDYGQHTKWISSTRDAYGTADTYDRYGPQDLFITDSRGYQGLLKALANEFLDVDNIANEEKIILNSPITAIQYNENGVNVTLANTTQYTAKYGIVTFSLGVLQSDMVQFIPKLPSWKIDSLLAFDFVDYVPIYVKWPYKFWNDSEFIFLNDDRFGFFPWIYNLDHPHLYNGSLIWRFDIALDLAQMVSVENINDTIKQIVDLKLSHYFDKVPNPDDIFVASWRSNKYIKGSYSSWPVGFSDESKKAMAWPIKKRLFFAGEAVHDWDYGFVHTAWLSGNETANKILSCIGYHASETNGFECPTEYVPPFDGDCKTVAAESVFKQLVWLWIVIGVVIGVILGYLIGKYFHKSDVNKVTDSNYGSVDKMGVPMITPVTNSNK